jgi:anti-sigma B factor antagonist
VPDLKLHHEMLPTGVAYIEAEGFLDAHTFEEMENLVSGVFRRNCFKLIVRLEKLDYISSAGAGVFVGAIGRARDNRGDIVFLRPSASVKEVFDLLGLTAIFRFADSRDDAESCF